MNTTFALPTRTPAQRRAARVAGALPATIAGIPCLIEVDSYAVVKGSFARDAASDWDYTGYTEIEFTVLDRRGYPARWLEGKLTETGKYAVEQLIREAHNG
jgi:hypothetical protein